MASGQHVMIARTERGDKSVALHITKGIYLLLRSHLDLVECNEIAVSHIDCIASLKHSASILCCTLCKCITLCTASALVVAAKKLSAQILIQSLMPVMLQAATGEDVSAEELGGAELHCTTSGQQSQYRQIYIVWPHKRAAN